MFITGGPAQAYLIQWVYEERMKVPAHVITVKPEVVRMCRSAGCSRVGKQVLLPSRSYPL